MSKPITAMAITTGMQKHCFDDETMARLEALTDLRPASEPQMTPENQLAAVRGAEIIITGWTARNVDDAQLEACPGLKLVAHAAGSVKGIFNPRFLERGVRVTSAAAINSGFVGEFSFGMMLCAQKAVFQYHMDSMNGIWDRRPHLDWMREPYGATVGVIGASFAGRRMIELCRTLYLEAILLYDPYVSADEARDMGAEKVEDLDELMRRSHVVSLHTPNIPETRHMINADNLALMQDHAIFINTARGACVDEEALTAELVNGRLFACLDVTHPEPPAPDSPLWGLPNCVLTPHIAGSIKENALMHGKAVADSIEAFLAGGTVPYEVPLEHLDRLA
jgi:phosphoglycerate dehydrogenase-like enzyme